MLYPFLNRGVYTFGRHKRGRLTWNVEQQDNADVNDRTSA